MSGLNSKQQAFVNHYLLHNNATKAAIAAGYSEATAAVAGSRLLRIVKIQQALNKKVEKIAEKVEVTVEYVLRGIKETVERCMQSAPVLDAFGRPVFVVVPGHHTDACSEGCEQDHSKLAPAYSFDPKNSLRGYELLGKYRKMFTDRVEVVDPQDQPVSDLSDEELEKILKPAANVTLKRKRKRKTSPPPTRRRRA